MLKPIKLGVFLPPANVYPMLSPNLLAGIELYLDERGGEAGGRQIEVVRKELELDAKLVPDKLHSMLAMDKVDVVTGCVGAYSLGLCQETLANHKVPMVAITPGASVPKNAQMGPYVFRNSLGLWQSNYAMSSWAVKQFGKRANLVPILLDAGYDSNFAVWQGVESEEGTVTRWFMADGSDFVVNMEPVIADSRELQPDFIYVNACGPKAVEIVKAYSESGLLNDIPMVGSAFAFEEPNLSRLGEAALGLKSAHGWASGLEHEEHGRFCRDFEEFAGRPAEGFAALGYESARLICEAIDAAGGDMAKTDELLASLNAAEFVSPRGSVKMDPANQTLSGPIHLREVRAIQSGSFANVAIGELPSLPERDEAMREVFERDEAHGWTNEYMCV